MTTSAHVGLLIGEEHLPAELHGRVPAGAWGDERARGRRWLDTTRLPAALAASAVASAAHLPIRGTLVHGDAAAGIGWWEAHGDGPLHAVYADPPYNTGSSDLPYPDDLPRDDWLARFPPLLASAWSLLAPGGAMFCSIDDTLLFHLKLAMDQALGEDAFLAAMPWLKRYSPAPDVRGIAYVHETVLAWRRSAAFRPGRLAPTAEKLRRYQNPDDDPRGRWKAMDYTCRFTREERPNLWYPVHRPDGSEVWPSATRVWSCSKAMHAENVRSGRVWWGKTGRNRMPALKKFLSE
ncbi:MAG: DNA methyltransferase, partial [Myxococcota bacterium]|nr:DNA methyltransferase [Myxococcota bacterium]